MRTSLTPLPWCALSIENLRPSPCTAHTIFWRHEKCPVCGWCVTWPLERSFPHSPLDERINTLLLAQRCPISTLKGSAMWHKITIQRWLLSHRGCGRCAILRRCVTGTASSREVRWQLSHGGHRRSTHSRDPQPNALPQNRNQTSSHAPGGTV